MKTEPKKEIEVQYHGNGVGRLLVEPFLLVGSALFWAIVLPIAALFSVLVTAEEQVRGYLFAPVTTGARVARHFA